MTLAAGTRLGAYEVLALVGAGGMGEVYRARDTKLARDVAIKILPDAFATDPERVARFQREAKTLASLNHPHIGGIYGLEEPKGLTALVLEFVEGPTLADRIAEGPIPVDEALPIARQIAEGLEAAHEAGVIHRDLKPANIKLTRDGAVKVLDFGLAKLADSPSGLPHASDVTQSPTLTSPAMTLRGVILGTAAYMSPEQARGKTVDKRSDIWAFGCVVYEMLTARRAFEGEDISDTLAAILRAEPVWTGWPQHVPSSLVQLLARCLDKDPRRRLRDMGEARIQLESITSSEAPKTDRRGAPAVLDRKFVIAASVAVCAVVTVAALSVMSRVSPASHSPIVQFVISPPPGWNFGFGNPVERSFAISPTGDEVVFVSAQSPPAGDRRDQLVLRPLDRLDVVPLSGTEGARSPFYSPDGEWIGFFSDGELRKVRTSGGDVLTITKVSGNPRGAGWGADGTIVFATTDNKTGLLAVSASGGEPRVLTTAERPESGEDHTFPYVLPNGRAVLFTQAVYNRIFQIAVLDLASREIQRLNIAGSHPEYVDDLGLIFWSGGMLHSVGFDADSLSVTGDRRIVAQGLASPNFNVSRSGSLVAARGVIGAADGSDRTFVWVDRQGREQPISAPPKRYGVRHLQVSPDGRRLGVDVADEERDIWVWDFERRTLTRVTHGSNEEWYPVWTPDGQALIFGSGPPGNHSLARAKADGTGTLTEIVPSGMDQFPQSITPDGRTLVFRQQTGNTARGDLYVIPLDGSGSAKPLLETPFVERSAAISPDGRWMAFDSDQSGRFEVYVRPFPDVASRQWQISAAGGGRPIWSRSGGELFFLGADRNMMVIKVNPGIDFSASVPTKLFDASTYYSSAYGLGVYDVSADGRRFVMLKELPSGKASEPPQLIVTTNWALQAAADNRSR